MAEAPEGNCTPRNRHACALLCHEGPPGAHVLVRCFANERNARVLVQCAAAIAPTRALLLSPEAASRLEGSAPAIGSGILHTRYRVLARAAAGPADVKKVHRTGVMPGEHRALRGTIPSRRHHWIVGRRGGHIGAVRGHGTKIPPPSCPFPGESRLASSCGTGHAACRASPARGRFVYTIVSLLATRESTPTG